MKKGDTFKEIFSIKKRIMCFLKWMRVPEVREGKKHVELK